MFKWGGTDHESGTVTISANNTKVTTGCKPKTLLLLARTANNKYCLSYYNEDVDATTQITVSRNGTSISSSTISVPPPSWNNPVIYSIDDDGFTINKANSTAQTTFGTSCYYECSY